MNYWYIPKRRIKRHRTRLSTVDVTPWARFYISKVVDPFGNFSGVMGQSELITFSHDFLSSMESLYELNLVYLSFLACQLMFCVVLPPKNYDSSFKKVL